MDLKFLTISNNEAGAFHAWLFEHYLEEYYKLRHDVFNQYNMSYYGTGADKFDEAQDTVFILLLNENRVVGGRRIVVHTPGSKTMLKTEESIDQPIALMLNHLNVGAMHYAELGGLCFSAEARGKDIAHQMYKHTFDAIKQLGCDFVVAEAVPNNLARIIQEAKENGCKQIIARTDQLSNDGLEDFRLFFSFKDKNELDLGEGTELTQEVIDSLIARRKELIQASSV
jgi:predicted GNAT family N-acyltransferase